MPELSAAPAGQAIFHQPLTPGSSPVPVRHEHAGAIRYAVADPSKTPGRPGGTDPLHEPGLPAAPGAASPLFVRSLDHLNQMEPRLRDSGRLVTVDGGIILRHTFAEKVQLLGQKVSNAIRNLFSLKSPAGSVFTSAPLRGFYSAFAVNSAAKFSVSASGLVQTLPKGVDAVPGGLGLGFTLIDAVFSGKDLADMVGGADAALGIMIKHRPHAERFVQDQSAETVQSYLSYMEAARKIPALGQDPADALVRAQISAARDCAVLPSAGTVSLAKSIGTAVETLTPVAGVALGVTASAGAVIAGGIDVAHGIKEYGNAKRQMRGQLSKIEAVGQWEGMPGTLQASAAGLWTHEHWQRNQMALYGQADRARLFGLLRAGKGVTVAAVGVTTLALGLTVGTGGAALALLPALVAPLYLASAAYKQHLRHAVEHTSKIRQRMARTLIETCSTAELIRMVEQKESRSVLFESRGKLEQEAMQVADNEYLALHLLAVRLAGRPQGLVETNRQVRSDLPRDTQCEMEAQEARAYLEKIGFDRIELDAILLAAQQQQPQYRLEFIKKRIASVYGLSLRLEADGHERPAPAQAHMQSFSHAAHACYGRGETYVSALAYSRHKPDFDNEVFPAISERLFVSVDQEVFKSTMRTFVDQTRLALEQGRRMPDGWSQEFRMLADFVDWLVPLSATAQTIDTVDSTRLTNRFASAEA